MTYTTPSISLKAFRNGLRLLLIMALACHSLTYSTAQSCNLNSFIPQDTIKVTSGLGSCMITTAEILDKLNLPGCSNVQLIPSGPYNIPTSKSIYIYDRDKDTLHSKFVLDAAPKSLSGISGVTVSPNSIFIKYSLPADKCAATKDLLLDQLNVVSDPIIRSKIHLLSGTSRITEFVIGDTTYLDRITCNDVTFYENIKVLFVPGIPTFNSVMTFDIGLTTCKVDIEDVLERLGYNMANCPASRFTISHPGPFGYGQHLIDFIKLDEYQVLKNAVVEVTPNGSNVPNGNNVQIWCPNDTIKFGMLPEGKCALNEFDIFEKLKLTTTGCPLAKVKLFPSGPYINSPANIDKIYIDGKLVCDGDFTVTFTRDTIEEVGSLICVQDLNITMGPDCSVKMSADVILANGNYCYLNYIIDLTFVSDPSTIIASGHEVEITQPGMYSLKITNPATGNSCWSHFKVEDKFIEEIRCIPDTIWCYDSALLIPNDSLGPKFPDIGPGIVYTPTTQHNQYEVSMTTLCGVAFASYEDDLVENCTEDNFKQIVDRTWTFEDNYGNSDTCVQRIYIRNTTIDSIKHFAPLSKNCISDFAKLDGNGNPHPESSGYPTIQDGLYAGICGTLKMTYSDTEFPLCGKGKKIVREWVVIDWCSDQVIELPQVIRIEDKKAPVILDDLENLSIDADPFICGGSNIELPLPNYEDCNVGEVILEIIYETYTPSGQLIKKSNGSSLFINQILSHDIVSTFLIEYILTDPCGNIARDSLMLTISDNEPPVAVCDEFTVISVGGNGTALVNAATFDDLSVDNCGIAKFEARKLNGKCDLTGIFTPDLRFCCDEVGDTILVEFRVTDLAGNSNICEVRVSIQDKFRPIISCPDDIVIDCGLDYLDLDLTGRPIARDNCPNYEVFFKDVINLNQCYQGTVKRTWMVRDKGDFTVSCVQVITILEDKKFTMDQAKFPSDTTIIGCHTSIEPAFTGKPVINTSSCAMVDATYSDLFFYDVENACVKILREWTVIDWCQRSESNSGIWKKDQIIKIVSDIGPEFLTEGRDTSYCIRSQNCSSLITITGIAIDGDGCTPQDELEWSYKLFTIDDLLLKSGIGPVVSSILPSGGYYIVFKVIDGCDNASLDTLHFGVTDCEAPKLICPSVQPSLVLNPSGKASLSVDDIVDISISDNCDDTEQLQLSFAKGQIISKIDFVCADLVNGLSDRFVKLYGRDLSGNIDSCELFLQIRDNSSNICGGKPKDTITVAGLITTREFSEVEDVIVKLKSNQGERMMITDRTGDFKFEYLGTDNNYTVEFEKDTHHDDGVSTLDILMTQRHILALNRFDSPYQVIAADVDNNGKVSSIDLVHLRRMVLGRDATFNTNGQKSWRFVDAGQKFDNPGVPFPFVDKAIFDRIDHSRFDLDFMAVKIGDVNGSNSISSRLKSFIRSAPIEVGIRRKGQKLLFISTTNSKISGFQLKFENITGVLIGSVQNGILPVSDDDYNISNDALVISWINENGETTIKKGDELFAIELNNISNYQEIIKSFKTEKSEWIDQGFEVSKIVLKEEIPLAEIIDKVKNIEITKISNAPNPFTDFTEISFDVNQSGNIRLDVFDISGKQYYNFSAHYESGSHAIHIDPKALNMTAGLYIVRLTTSSSSYVHRLTFVQ